MVYQKDGPGPLKRVYLDRIFDPVGLKDLQLSPLKSITPLKCKKCQRVIGVPYVYSKEKRKAFMIEMGSVAKKALSAASYIH